MEKHQTFITIVKIMLMILLTFCFVFYVFQKDNLEERIRQMQGNIKSVKDSAEASQAKIETIYKMLRSGVITTGGETRKEARKWLHPEVENFLKPDPFDYVDEEAAELGKDRGVLWRRWSSDPKGFNPILENDATLRQKLNDLCMDYTCYAHWNDPYTYAPRLAERIEIIDDYKTWIFYFRKGVKWQRPALVDWSSGRYGWLDKEHEVTAHDFAFCLKMSLHPDVQAGHRKNYYEKIDSYKAIDDYTLEVRWKEKQFQCLDAMTDMFFPLPRFVYEYDEEGKKIPEEQIGKAFNDHWFNQKYVGCGPYEMVDYKRGEYLKLKRNEFYWGKKPLLKEINYYIYTDPKQVLLKMKSGEQDFAETIRYEYLKEETENPNSPFAQGKIHIKNYPMVGYTYIGWNSANPMFSDKRTRRAMTLAANREAMLSSLGHGLGTLVTGPFYHDSAAYDKSIDPWPFNLDEARRLLSECGWEDSDGDGIRDKIIDGEKKSFKFTLFIWKTSPQWLAMAGVYKNDLQKIGVEMHDQPIEWSSMLKKMNNKEFDAFTGFWLINYKAQPYQLWHSSQADIPRGSNRVGFRNKRADEIIETGRKTFDKKKRAELFKELHQIIHEEQPYTFFYSPIYQAVWWDHVKNVKFRKERPHTIPLPYYIDK